MNGNSLKIVSEYRKDETNRSLLNLKIVDSRDYEKENRSEDEEENAISELNDVAILSASKISLKIPTKTDEILDSKNKKQKSKFGKYFEKLPLKGILLAICCTIFGSISAIFTKLTTELGGK